MQRAVRFGACLAIAFLVVAACGDAAKLRERRMTQPGEENTPKGAGGNNPGISLSGGTTGISLDGSAQGAGTGDTLNPDSACGVGTETATLSPVNMLVMMDRSRSMATNQKWDQASAALVAFFGDPGTAGLAVGLRFFPDDTPVEGCSEPNCSSEACSSPLVQLGKLTAEAAPTDTQEKTLIDAVNATAGEGNGTPLYAALGGAEQWAIAHQTSHPDEKTVVILVTDGRPRGCGEDMTAIAKLAEDAHQSNQILTYAIGLEGSAEEDMHSIAKAGGTTEGIFIGSSSDAQTKLLEALTAIRGKSLSCDFPVPKPTAGSALDPTRINVSYTPSGAAESTTLGQVPNAAECATTRSWHYDNAAAPTRIFLCPSACDMVRADASSKLQILIGCSTQITPPR